MKQELDRNASEIMDMMLSSEVKADLLVLFHKNPGLIDTIDNVARRIGRSGSAIEKDVKDLAELGILKVRPAGKFEAIYLDRERDSEIQNIIASYLKTLNPVGEALRAKPAQE